MAGNPKDSPWYATPQEARRRKAVILTLSDEARARLDALAEQRGTSKSALVEALIASATEDEAKAEASPALTLEVMADI